MMLTSQICHLACTLMKERQQERWQMDLTLRHWSATHTEAIVTFYTFLFFGHAEADKVVSRMIEQFHEDNISVTNLSHL